VNKALAKMLDSKYRWAETHKALPRKTGGGCQAYCNIMAKLSNQSYQRLNPSRSPNALAKCIVALQANGSNQHMGRLTREFD